MPTSTQYPQSISSSLNPFHSRSSQQMPFHQASPSRLLVHLLLSYSPQKLICPLYLLGFFFSFIRFFKRILCLQGSLTSSDVSVFVCSLHCFLAAKTFPQGSNNNNMGIHFDLILNCFFSFLRCNFASSNVSVFVRSLHRFLAARTFPFLLFSASADLFFFVTFTFITQSKSSTPYTCEVR